MGRSFRRRLWFVAVPIASLVLMVGLLFAAQRPTAATSTVLTIFTGVAEVARGSLDFVAAADGTVLQNTDWIRTDATGHALITFFDGSTLEIEPSTVVQVMVASPNANGSITIELLETIGRTWASVQKLTHADSKFEIRTPTSTATVRGTGFLTEVLPSGETTILTTDGAVAVSAQGRTVLVVQGQRTTIRPGEPPTPADAVPAPATALRFGMHSPAYLVVVDPLGRSCGIASAAAAGSGASVLRHVPRCSATAPGTEPQLIEMPDAIAGTYRVVIVSIAPGGPFTLTAAGVDERGLVSFDLALPGGGQPGAMFGSSLDVRTGPDGRLSATSLSALVALQRPPTQSKPATQPAPSANVSASRLPTALTSVSPSAPASTVPPSARPTSPGLTPAPTITASATPLAAASRPALRTPAPEPSSIATATPTATPAPTAPPAESTSRPALRTPPPEPSVTPTPSPTATPAPSASPTPVITSPPTPTALPGCTPSTNQPKKCVPG